MVNIITQLLMLLTLISGILTRITIFYQHTILIEWDVLVFNNITINIPIIIDSTRIIFITTVMLIACRVIQFSKTYIIYDPTLNRFILLVLTFVISIIFLILFPHTIILLIGWDGLGITSFVLVIYYNNAKRLGAGIITALTNRIGDVMLLIAIATILNQGHWLVINIWDINLKSWTIILIIIAAITKSAQIPFRRWLPAAIAAPTPVSALVHSSTLVTAGVYLLYRFAPLIESWNKYSIILIIISSTTILIAGARAIIECDIKKIIALSTLSQVAIIIFTLRIGLIEIAFFHLITHALFKALLFICAGNLIDIHHHNQNLRRIGNRINQIPVLASAITIANLALCGAPFIAGFYSKDLIIETITIITRIKNLLILIIFISATVLTTAYSVRFRLYTLIKHTNRPAAQYSSENKTQIFSIIILTILAITGGAITNWLIITPVIEPNFSNNNKFCAIIIILLGIIIGRIRFLYPQSAPNSITQSICHIWYLTPLSTHTIPNLVIKLPLIQVKYIDQGWSTTPLLIFKISILGTLNILKSQNNTISYTIIIIILLIIWIWYQFNCLSSLN